MANNKENFQQVLGNSVAKLRIYSKGGRRLSDPNERFSQNTLAIIQVQKYRFTSALGVKQDAKSLLRFGSNRKKGNFQMNKEFGKCLFNLAEKSKIENVFKTASLLRTP